MSKIIDTTIGGGLIGYDKRINRRFFSNMLGNVTKKRTKYARIELRNLPTFSLLSECADAWNALTSGEKNAWEDPALRSYLSAYNQFIQDKSYRIINEIAGNATPSLYHQYLIGHVYIPVGAGHFLLRQVAPYIFVFPATLYISSYTDLRTDNGGGAYLKVRFKYKYNEGAGELEQSNEISLALSAAWHDESLAITEHTGQTGHWELEIEGDAVEGDFYFDNYYCSASDGVVTKDSVCERTDKVFNQLVIPDGVIAESIYPND